MTACSQSLGCHLHGSPWQSMYFWSCSDCRSLTCNFPPAAMSNGLQRQFYPCCDVKWATNRPYCRSRLKLDLNSLSLSLK